MLNFMSADPAAVVATRSIAEIAVGSTSRVGPDVQIAGRCKIGEQALLDGLIQIGRNVEIGSASYLMGPLTIEAGARIGPKCCLDGAGQSTILIGEDAVLSANTTVWPGVTIGKSALVEPGSVVTKDVPAMAVVAGNPAQIVRYCGVPSAPAEIRAGHPSDITPTTIPGVTLRRLPLHEDLRGNLTFAEAQRHVPFPIQRYFLTFAVSSEQVRGEHAHHSLHQFLVCVHGRVHIAADDGTKQADFLLDRPDIGIHIPPMVWSVQYRFSADAVLLGLCSDNYNPDDYIRDYTEFVKLARGSNQTRSAGHSGTT